MKKKINKLINDHQSGIITSYEFEQQLLTSIIDGLPSETDIRPEITEWNFNKNRDEANGYNQAIDECKEAIKLLFENE